MRNISIQLNNSRFLLPFFLLVVFVSTIWMATSRHSSKHYAKMIHWDAEGYYMYLPAIFINHGFVGMYTKTEKEEGIKTFQNYPGTQKLYTKFTCGVAIMETPFFLIAHAYVTALHLDPEHGYADPYMVLIIIGVAFYLTIGFWFVIKTLLRYVSLPVAIFSSLILWLGTNLLHYSALGAGYAHSFAFLFSAMVIYYTHLYYKFYKLKHLLIIAFSLGFLTLLRPTDILIGLFFFLYNIYSFAQLKDRIAYWLKEIKRLLLFPLMGFLCYIPQFIYWKYISGSWLIYSYQNEGFTLWKHPMLPEIWYHPQNGLFLYEPLLVLSIAGIFLSWKTKKLQSPTLLLIFLLNSYICASWWYWNFGASYGYRPFIDFLPLLALPLAFMIQRISQSKYRVISFAVIFFLLFLSVRLNFIYHWPWQGPDWGWDDVWEQHLKALFLK